MQTVSGLSASLALPSILAQDQSQAIPVQTSSALASESASQVTSATAQSLVSAPALSLGETMLAKHQFVPATQEQINREIDELLGAQKQADKTDEKKAKRDEKAESVEKPGKVVPSEKRNQIVGYASNEILKIVQQNATTMLGELLSLLDLRTFGHETIAVLQASESLSPEERAVTKWVANFLAQQLKESIPLRVPTAESAMKLYSTKLVQAKAKELCARMQAISADWVENLVLDTKAGTAI